MRLFFIRHGETEHNIAGLLAGVTDSRLTNHGALQTQRLGSYLISDRGLRFTNVYSSDLQRARITANEICKAQNKLGASRQAVDVTELKLLREQDFGSFELVSWTSRHTEDALDSQTPKPTDANFKPKETTGSMKDRATVFLDDYIVPLFAIEHEQSSCIAIVSHGIFLAHLWRTLFARFKAGRVTISSSIDTDVSSRPLDRMAWSNTGCLEVDVKLPNDSAQSLDAKSSEPTRVTDDEPFAKALMVIKAINDKRHLLRLKRARGGIGSATHDQRQQNIGSFFKKRKLESNGQEDSKPKKPRPDPTL